MQGTLKSGSDMSLSATAVTSATLTSVASVPNIAPKPDPNDPEDKGNAIYVGVAWITGDSVADVILGAGEAVTAGGAFSADAKATSTMGASTSVEGRDKTFASTSIGVIDYDSAANVTLKRSVTANSVKVNAENNVAGLDLSVNDGTGWGENVYVQYQVAGDTIANVLAKKLIDKFGWTAFSNGGILNGLENLFTKTQEYVSAGASVGVLDSRNTANITVAPGVVLKATGENVKKDKNGNVVKDEKGNAVADGFVSLTANTYVGSLHHSVAGEANKQDTDTASKVTVASAVLYSRLDNDAAIDLQSDATTHKGVTLISDKGDVTLNAGAKQVYDPLEPMKNIVDRTIEFQIDDRNFEQVVPAAFCVDGPYVIRQVLHGAGTYKLAPGDSVEYSVLTGAWKQGEELPEWDGAKEVAARRALVDEWFGDLVLETPDQVLNRMFAFSKIRSQESIYATKAGPMHGPGGEAYYAAIWANDQAEYVNPFFPFTGYDYGCASALNSYLLFARYMNDEYKPIPSSIIAEGTDIWNGAGDRGDAAMIAYGAARYALARGSREEAEQLWPLIQWCLEYCHRKLLPEGVVASDHDELEGRFPAGKANLCTSSLYYDALLSSASLCRELGQSKTQAATYRRQAQELRRAMESYFGAEVEGFHTYRYYDGNDVLRSWICIPLCMGITERAEGTIQALFSPRLWTENGMLTQAGSQTFWDRSTLYALRGVYAAGEPDKATEFLHFYSNARLLGEHVPYAIEAWPEGSQRHLSAESGLYARIITEGLFGIRPTGFRSFDLTPQLPASWNEMTLRRIRAFGSCFDIRVSRQAQGKVLVTLTDGTRSQTYKAKAGETLHLKL